MITIAIYNLKGGVGKTTSAVNLAHLASTAKKNTVLWDWDPQAAATWYFGLDDGERKAIRLLRKGEPFGTLEIISPFPNLSIVPADLSLRQFDTDLAGMGAARRFMRQLIKPVGKNTDILIFDCPPTLSPSMEFLLSGVDLMLVPMIPSPLSLRAMHQVTEFFQEQKQPPRRIHGFFNMVDMRRSIHKQTLESAKLLPLPVLKTLIPMDSAAEQMSEMRAPLTSYARAGRAATAYRAMWKEIARVLRTKAA
ncbi:MAG: ParA family protein [Cellvibrionaceae bacterium]|nr:ParA family protein [Cellvibrionaceae bacterium]